MVPRDGGYAVNLSPSAAEFSEGIGKVLLVEVLEDSLVGLV